MGHTASTNHSNDPEIQDQVKRVLSKIKKPVSKRVETEGGNNSNKITENVYHMPSKYPMLRRRRRLIVIAIDCYDSNGLPKKKMAHMVQEIIKATRLDSQTARVLGFALSTAMPVAETLKFLRSRKIQVNEFDTLICSSGGEVYYPGTYAEGDGRLYPDPDYASHIDYRWACEGLETTMWKLLNTSERGEKSNQAVSPIQLDEKSSNAHCISHLINDPSKARRVDDLRQKLRRRGLRCHPMYCRRSTRIQIVPLLASRAQALRYLFVHWKLNVSNMYVFIGEGGDTDYEELISGTHKTIIMKGAVEKVSEELLRTSGSYARDDIVPRESPLATYVNEQANADEITNALKQVSVSGSKM